MTLFDIWILKNNALVTDPVRLGSCEMFSAGDSGFSELASMAGSSEDENQPSYLPDSR